MVNIKTMPLGDYQTNCYLVWADGSDTCAVIDPGYEPERVIQKAKQLGKSIEAILLTHGHFDHVGAVKEIAKATGCQVYLGGEELSMPEYMTAGELYYTNLYSYGDVVAVGGVAFKVMHTPGHTPGSVCLITEDCIFSGDTLFAGSCGRTDFPGGSWSQIQTSLKQLAGLEKNHSVYPGHGESTTLDKERMYNPYMG